MPERLTMHAHTSINYGCLLDGEGDITVHEYSRIGVGVRILTTTHKIGTGWNRRGPTSADIHLPVVIERGCWINAGVTITPGVTVAEGCVIGANSLVRRSTEANGLYGNAISKGNDYIYARRIRDLPM